MPDDSIENQAKLALKIIRNNELYKKNMDAFLTDFSFEKEMKKLKNSIHKVI